jgi:hypothetical protein
MFYIKNFVEQLAALPPANPWSPCSTFAGV